MEHFAISLDLCHLKTVFRDTREFSLNSRRARGHEVTLMTQTVRHLLRLSLIYYNRRKWIT